MEEFIRPQGWTVERTAELLGMDRGDLEGLIGGHHSITPGSALELQRLFGSSEGFWLNLQEGYDLHRADGGGEA
jgi:addiction module HigA family antidote